MTDKKALVDHEGQIWQKALIDAALDAVIIIDEKGIVLDFNRSAEMTFGYKRAEVLGKLMGELIVPPALRDGHRQGLERLRRTGIGKILGQRLELSAVRRDGTEFPVELIVVQVEVSPRPVYVGYVRDISEQKQAEETLRASEQRFRNLADTAPVMIWLSDGNHQRNWFNRVWLEFVGRSMEDEVGAGWLSGVHPDDFQSLSDTYEGAILATKPYATEYRLRHRDGSFRWILDHGTPLFDSSRRCTGYAGSCIDITERRAAEDALKVTQFSVDRSGDAVFWVGPEAELLYVNDRACESLGYSRDELAKMTVLDISPDFPREEWSAHWKKLKELGSFSLETIHQRKDGSTFPVDISVNYLEYNGREINCAVARDVSERREQEQRIAASEEKLRAISDAAIDAVVLADPEGLVAHWNPAAEKMFGYTKEEISSRKIHEVLTPERFRDEANAGWSKFTETGLGPIIGEIREMYALHQDGHEFPVELSVSNVELNERWWAVAVVRDASERKRVERELRQAMQDAQAANRAKSEFLALVSHEMRTPLNSILGMIELALDTTMTADQRQMLTTSRQSGKQLKRLISDMLDFSQIEVGQFDLKEDAFDLTQSLTRMQKDFLPRAEGAGLGFTWQVDRDVPNRVVGDSRRLEQVIENLVHNAIKFTEHGYIAFRAELVSQKDDVVELRFSVVDTGIGVKPENRDRIFQRFEQVDSSSTRAFGGIGLGLSICAQLVNRMNGEIRHQDGPDGGSNFSFTVKLRQLSSLDVEKAIEPVAEFTAQDVSGLRALLAEDDPPSRALATRILEKAGIRVTQAVDGQDAVEKFDSMKDQLDVVFLDIMMPRLDGLEATQQIRKLQTRPIPIVAMTAQAMKGDRERFLEGGMDSYISKPIDANTVLETLGKMMGKASAPKKKSAAWKSSSRVVFDEVALRRRCDDDEELIAEVVELFGKTCTDMLERIDRGIAEGDLDEIVSAAHRLKGASGDMCGPRASSAAKDVEEAAREERTSGMTALRERLGAEVRRLLAAIEATTRGA